MFCPKCGQQNPETGKFCRSCGTDLGNVTQALTGALPQQRRLVNHKGKPIHLEGAIAKLFSGLAFIIVACILGYTHAAGGQGWWFWLLIPGFGSLGSGVAQLMQIRRADKNPGFAPPDNQNIFPGTSNSALPPPHTEWVAPDSRYKTGDLVPPSVTDGTTRHLEMDSEGQTKPLSK